VAGRLWRMRCDLLRTLTEMRQVVLEEEEWMFAKDASPLGEQHFMHLEVLFAELKALEQQVKRMTWRVDYRGVVLRVACEEEQTDAIAPYGLLGEPLDDDDLSGDALYPLIGSFLQDPNEQDDDTDWHGRGRVLAMALWSTLDRLRDHDALSRVAGRNNDVLFTGHPVRWLESAACWHLNGSSLEAGDRVYLLTDNYAWLPGRYESGAGGWRAMFCFRLGVRELGQTFSLELGDEHRLAWPKEIEGR
jgi:hypothetical protein